MLRVNRRRLAHFLRIGEPIIDALGLVAICALFVSYLSTDVLNSRPATGGDTGSHFWPLVTLVEHSLPNLSVRVWNPGNLGGEPHLVHYFPFPYLVMAAISLFVPLGMAFNLGTLLPLLLLPFSAYLSIRLLGFRFPSPLLAAGASLLSLYNESYSMWGGNTLSTMAGQFTHAYALNLLLAGIGLLAYEHRWRAVPYLSACTFAAVATSHAYVLLGIPFIVLAFLLFHHEGSLRSRSIVSLQCGLLSVLLSVWFLVPLLDNAPWTIAFFNTWVVDDLIAEVFPPIFHPAAGVLAVSLLLLIVGLRSRRSRRSLLSGVMIWLVPSLAYLVYYFIFPALGLIDVRAVPQIQLFLSVMTGLLAGMCLSKLRVMAFFCTPFLLVASIFWADIHVGLFPHWVPWNYSGWEDKPAYKDLSRLYAEIKGDFSMPRVVYEHSELNNQAGTLRVFEMLPYFTGRATLESCYLQASILAPAAFLIQSEVSRTPSCPFVQYECKPFSIEAARMRLELLGVSDLILVTPPLIAQARASSYLREVGEFGQWTLFRTIKPATLVEVFDKKPYLVSDDIWKGRYTRLPQLLPNGAMPPNAERLPVDMSNWKDAFYYWFMLYAGVEPMMISERNLTPELIDELRSGRFDPVWQSTEECTPSVEVGFDRIRLRTPCRGRAHFLKFAYHPAWRADSGDPLYLVSPGFIALVPSRDEVTLTFGPVRRWQLAGAISMLAFAWTIFGLMSRLSKRRFGRFAGR